MDDIYKQNSRQRKMSRGSLKTGILKDHNQTMSTKVTSQYPPTSNQASSILHSSLSSSNSLSMTFMKDLKCPKLFLKSPSEQNANMLFSFNPQSTKNMSIGRKSPMNRSSGTRTPSLGGRGSLKSLFQSSRKAENKSLFGKKKTGFNKDNITIDLAKETKQNKPSKRVSYTYHNSVAKDFLRKSSLSSKNNHQLESTCSQQPSREQNIKVYIRIKPSEEFNCEEFQPYVQKVDDHHIRIQDKIKAYDHIFPMDSRQKEVFQTVGKPILEKVIEGYNGTIFAYGQTGSGKTFTIFGEDGKPQNQGLIPLCIRYLSSQENIKMKFSLLEIYKQELIDLLASVKTDLKLKQTNGGVYVDGLSKLQFENSQLFLEVIEQASKLRKVNSTKINEKSSRSHTILTVFVQKQNFTSKLCLIDLAGSQKINKAGVSGQALEETKKINYSLSCLGNVINALVKRKKNDHIPFRDSKLTRLLKDSLTGKFKTSLIVNCASEFGTEDESISSLKFADRTKKIKITLTKASTKDKENIEYLHLLIRKLTTDLENTKKQLHKYKEICSESNENSQNKSPREEVQITARQTIPSERVNIEEVMEKYGKENIRVNKQEFKEKKGKFFMDLGQISSLNVSKSVSNIFADLSGPSVSSLSHRVDQNSQDLSLNLSLNRTESLREKIQ